MRLVRQQIVMNFLKAVITSCKVGGALMFLHVYI